MPQWYLDEPMLAPIDQFYLKAFGDLNTCRQIGMAAGPIPWTSIKQYADDVGLDDGMRVAFVGVIQAMDRVYLEWIENQRPASGEPSRHRNVER